MAMRPKNPLPPEVRRLKAFQMRTIINEVRNTLWFDLGSGSPVAAPDKQWSTPMLDDIAAALEAHGLKPKSPKPKEPRGQSTTNEP